MSETRRTSNNFSGLMAALILAEAFGGSFQNSGLTKEQIASRQEAKREDAYNILQTKYAQYVTEQAATHVNTAAVNEAQRLMTKFVADHFPDSQGFSINVTSPNDNYIEYHDLADQILHWGDPTNNPEIISPDPHIKKVDRDFRALTKQLISIKHSSDKETDTPLSRSAKFGMASEIIYSYRFLSEQNASESNDGRAAINDEAGQITEKFVHAYFPEEFGKMDHFDTPELSFSAARSTTQFRNNSKIDAAFFSLTQQLVSFYQTKAQAVAQLNQGRTFLTTTQLSEQGSLADLNPANTVITLNHPQHAFGQVSFHTPLTPLTPRF